MVDGPRKELKLNPEERQSAVWNKIRSYLVEELLICREKNDGNIQFTETMMLRGRIKFIKQLLGSEKDSAFTAE